MTDYETILIETQGRVGWITLNRPEALNALNSQIMQDVAAAASVFDADEGIVRSCSPGRSGRSPRAPTSGEQSQHLVSCERQREGLQRAIDVREHQLVGSHDRGDRRHAIGRRLPAVRDPLALHLGDRIDR